MYMAYQSHVGAVRQNNEDAIQLDEANGIFIIADGMGGHQAGQIASQIAVDTVLTFLQREVESFLPDQQIPTKLTEAILTAHEKIIAAANADLHRLGMGATIVIAMLRANRAWISHVGDSRAYLISQGIRQLTQGHTLGQFLLDHKLATREEIPTRKWHTLMQALGGSEPLSPALMQVTLQSGDYLVMCSDGLSDMVPAEEIYRLVVAHRDQVELAVPALIKEALNRGGFDNISAILIRI